MKCLSLWGYIIQLDLVTKLLVFSVVSTARPFRVVVYRPTSKESMLKSQY